MSTPRKRKEKKDPTLNAQLLSARPEIATAARRWQSAKVQAHYTNQMLAGIDVGARIHYVAVPEGRAEVSVRSFGAYTAQLDELVQWLKDCRIKNRGDGIDRSLLDPVVPEARRSWL